MYNICAMYGSYYSSSSGSSDFFVSSVWIIVSIVITALICGFATKTINENKGYEGGFLWGFLCGFIGLIVMACKPVSKDFYKNESYEDKKESQTVWNCETCGFANLTTYKSCRNCGKPRS
ncbi:MAG: hypothetical protein IKS03_06750 [Ruminococcus sp.]|nr:hypothetical protein [Ruminococcus sp.]